MLMRDAARRMRDGGRIINISTLNTVLISPGTTAYAASKAALELMTRVAAAELGGRGITVNSVSPGATDTDMFRTANPAEGTYERVAAMTPLGRIGQPADVASVVAFLAGPDGRWLTGQNLRASGGLG
jgi:3-oxoacyl-[acyl-carrier protein] reductase